eukprot:537589-Prymnesium_polylepis.1
MVATTVRFRRLCSSAAAQLSSKLAAAKHTLALAESSSGGLMASELLALPGASAVFRGGVVAYSKTAKTALLGLDAAKTKPTASEPHAIEMARAARERLGTDWALGETGVAGPTPNSHG